jgi:hypothetical protein
MTNDEMIPRYERKTGEPDRFTYDVIYVDRMTGNVVMRYDGADPANTNPAYGAISDEEAFRRRGLDIHEEMPLSRAAVAVPPNEPELWRKMKERLAAREQEEADAVELFAFLDARLAQHGVQTEDFDFDHYRSGEENILRPALEKLGYSAIGFYMIEQDSFGPLIRGVVAHDPSGKRVRFFYG